MLFFIKLCYQDNWGLSFIVPGIIMSALGVLMFFILVPTPAQAGFVDEEVREKNLLELLRRSKDKKKRKWKKKRKKKKRR